MLENFALPKIIPIGVVLFNFLFFLIAIPIEAYIFHNRLKFDKKTSTFYAISVNLFSGVIGWVAFFLSEPILAIDIKSELINYVFFNSFKSANTPFVLIVTAFIIFFATFLAKFLILRILLVTLTEKPWEKKEETQISLQRRKWRTFSMAKLQNTNLVTTTLIANSLSYSVITIILLLRYR
ncbi:MAG: filament integrity protein fraC [Desmonostoc vinosum HA7617-LM4]|jgi:hypothetical protein|nr:filament integrity protein fraC [Desmonostoc vinosum HA7617-LM4]